MVTRPGAARRVIVVGGGIAGIAAAVRLADAGVRVTILETRKKLGGRATSFDDARTGQRLDNCQHIVMGCCTNFLDLLNRLGVSGKIAWSRSIWWIEPGGRRSVMHPGLAPAPAHFAGSFLRARFLGAEDKVSIAGAMHRLARARLVDLEDETFAEWLARAEQTEPAVERFWAPVVVSACNGWPGRVAASEAAHVFQEGFLAHRDAARIGVPTTPLVELYDAAAGVIERAGGAVRLGVSVARLEPSAVETASGDRLEADRVICATPFERALSIVAQDVQATDPRFAAMRRLEHSPILGVHLTFDAPVLDLPHAALVGTGTQWLFRKDDAGARVHAVVSAADPWMSLNEDEIVGRVVEDVRRCLPGSRGARLVAGRPVKEKRATFLPTIESVRARPAVSGPSGVILAADYVRTGWPSTMEGAARAGYLAAGAALGLDGSWALRPSLRPAALYRAARALAGADD
ncbi:MAG: FAD-dependent oxidoreductase [Planctomycetota bacterium]|nr:MAG: FAD-dependent oxidoreductase [Planctomycetota bacterium]